MTLREEIAKNAADAFQTSWSVTDGRVVPDTENIGMGNVGRKLNATVLYADLADSTAMVRAYSSEFSAEVYKTYLYAASRLIRAYEGTVTAFDGDRVMGVFVGDAKNSNATTCALKINWVVEHVLQVELRRQYTSSSFTIRQKVGIDSSDILVARTGIRGSNDLVWVGNSANNAAKMAALDLGYTSYISGLVYERLSDAAKYASGTDMWTHLGSRELGYSVYGSNYEWSF